MTDAAERHRRDALRRLQDPLPEYAMWMGDHDTEIALHHDTANAKLFNGDMATVRGKSFIYMNGEWRPL